MHMPNGVVWCGSYVKKSTCVEGLEQMMNYYSVKPLHLILIHYIGGPDFELEIFNPYAVEITYPFKIQNNQESNSRDYSGESFQNGICDIELDKLFGNLCFNALNKSREIYQLVIEIDHLEYAEAYLVFSQNLQHVYYFIISCTLIYIWVHVYV